MDRMLIYVFCRLNEAAWDVCSVVQSQHKKASNHHANLPLEMYSFTL